MASKFHMTEDDTAPDVSPLEELLELRLLTAGPVIGPVDCAERHPDFPEF